LISLPERAFLNEYEGPLVIVVPSYLSNEGIQ
jgi:hypothetical protein